MALHTTNPGDTKRQMNLAPFMEWSATQQYNVDDLVVSSSGVWKAKINNRAQNPDENTFWTKVVGGSSPFSATGCIEISSTTDNSLEICGSTSGAPVSIKSSGIDADVEINIQPRNTVGNGAVVIGPGRNEWAPALKNFISFNSLVLTPDATNGWSQPFLVGTNDFDTGWNSLANGGSLIAPATYSATNAMVGGWTAYAFQTSSDIATVGSWELRKTGTSTAPNSLPGDFIILLGDGTAPAPSQAFRVTPTVTFTPGLQTSGTVTHLNLGTSNPGILGRLYMTTTARLLAVSSG